MVHTKVSSFKKGGKTVVVTLGDLGYSGYVPRSERKEIVSGFRDLVQNSLIRAECRMNCSKTAR